MKHSLSDTKKHAAPSSVVEADGFVVWNKKAKAIMIAAQMQQPK